MRHSWKSEESQPICPASNPMPISRGGKRSAPHRPSLFLDPQQSLAHQLQGGSGRLAHIPLFTPPPARGFRADAGRAFWDGMQSTSPRRPGGKNGLAPHLPAPAGHARCAGVGFETGRGWKGAHLRLFGASGQDRQVHLTWTESLTGKITTSNLAEKTGTEIKDSLLVPAWGIITLKED